MLSTGGMLSYARAAEHDVEREAGREHGDAASSEAHSGGQPRPREAVVATETGMLYPLQMAAPDVNFIPANPEASCMYMKMITLPKLRDCLRDRKYEVRVPEEIAARARVPIDRMVAID